MIGQTVAQYEITARLGGGGMGVVYLAKDTKLGRQVALKFLPPQWCHDDAAKQRFLREAQAASATNHKNICIIHDIEQTDDGQLFIVMAHYEGPTLKQKLESGALPPFEALEIAGEIAEGLAKAHSQGVVHRDIKPGNIIVTEDGVKILDFGLAKLADAALKLTLEGSTVGTVAYMSPEQARGEEADERSDIWSIGVVLYEMLVGDVPFQGAYPEAIFYAIKNEEPARLSSKVRDLPEGVEAIVNRALAKNPAERYATAREMARQLRLLVGRSLPLDLRTEPIVAPTRSHAIVRKRRLRWAAAGALLLLLGAGGAYWWLARPLPRTPISIVPVANHSGDGSLDSYRLALTQGLITELGDSPNLRVTPYTRLLESIRPYLAGAEDMSGRGAIATIARDTGSPMLVIPSLENNAGSWRAKAELRNVQTGTVLATVETDPVQTSLPHETAQRLVTSLAAKIQAHFKPRWPHRVPEPSPASGRFRSLDAARAFEHGINAFEQNEYSAADASFRQAIQQDDQRALPHLWSSKVALLMGDIKRAEVEARSGAQLIGSDERESVALLAGALLSEARGDLSGAEQKYRALAALRTDDVALQIELADFLRRKNRNTEAVEAFHRVLAVDPGYARPHVDLCQLYAFLDDYPLSEQHAQTALKQFRASGNRGGEAQALLCHADALLQQRKLTEGRKEIEAARAIFESLGYQYGLARIFHYLGLAAGREPNYPAAAQAYEEALSRSLQAGNRVLQGVALMNLGVIHESMGHPSQALAFYERSRDVYRQLGDERRAAEPDVNAAALQVTLGLDPKEVSARLTNAVAILRKLGLVDFEVQAIQAQGENEAAAGQLDAAQRTLHEAATIATERGLKNRVALVSVAAGNVALLRSDYEGARKILSSAATESGGADVHIALGRAFALVGDTDASRQQFARAESQLTSTGALSFAAVLHLAYGELSLDAGAPDVAKKHFVQAAAWGEGDSLLLSAVEARCRLGQFPPSLRSLANVQVRARCAVEQSRVEVDGGSYAKALETLRDMPPDGVQIGSELMANVHHLRSAAYARQHDVVNAETERKLATRLVQQIQSTLSPAYKDRFAARLTIRALLE